MASPNLTESLRFLLERGGTKYRMLEGMLQTFFAACLGRDDAKFDRQALVDMINAGITPNLILEFARDFQIPLTCNDLVNMVARRELNLDYLLNDLAASRIAEARELRTRYRLDSVPFWWIPDEPEAQPAPVSPKVKISKPFVELTAVQLEVMRHAFDSKNHNFVSTEQQLKLFRAAVPTEACTMELLFFAIKMPSVKQIEPRYQAELSGHRKYLDLDCFNDIIERGQLKLTIDDVMVMVQQLKNVGLILWIAKLKLAWTKAQVHQLLTTMRDRGLFFTWMLGVMLKASGQEYSNDEITDLMIEFDVGQQHDTLITYCYDERMIKFLIHKSIRIAALPFALNGLEGLTITQEDADAVLERSPTVFKELLRFNSNLTVSRRQIIAILRKAVLTLDKLFELLVYCEDKFHVHEMLDIMRFRGRPLERWTPKPTVATNGTPILYL